MKRPDSSGATNYVGYFSTGALRPPHPRKLGAAFLLLLKLEDMVTRADGDDGLVFGGSPVSDRRLAKEMGVARSTIFEWRRRLTRGRYITARKTDQGFAICVRKSLKAYLLQRRKPAAQDSAYPLPETLHPPAESQTPPAGNLAAYKEDIFSKTYSEKTRALKHPAPAKKPPAPARQATEFAFQSFRQKYGQPPTWSKADYAQAASLFKRRPDLTVGEFRRRWSAFLASTEAFTRKQSGSLKYFCTYFDRFIAGPVQDLPQTKGGGNGKPAYSVAESARAFGFSPVSGKSD